MIAGSFFLKNIKGSVSDWNTPKNYQGIKKTTN